MAANVILKGAIAVRRTLFTRQQFILPFRISSTLAFVLLSSVSDMLTIKILLKVTLLHEYELFEYVCDLKRKNIDFIIT